MGLFNNLQAAGSQLKKKASGNTDDSNVTEGADPNDTEILDDDEGSIILSLISQLRIGMDLSKVTFPTFVLEPRSMLERITDFMAHPELIFGAENIDSPEERFIRVLQYYLSGWHIKPKGVKKPYNPVLGEFFRCKYNYKDGSQGFYVAEQVSHHPPISAYFYMSPANRVRITGELRPKSKFLGNSVCTVIEGENRVFLTGRPEDGEYILTMPNMYARGILWGKMVLEIADSCSARNDNTGITADIDFKAKGFFTGTYNTVHGKIKGRNGDIGEINGRWSHAMTFTPAGSSEKRILFDAQNSSEPAPKSVPQESEQEPHESRRLWQGLTSAIQAKNMDAATEAKSAVEEGQREMRRKREESGRQHVPRFFELRDGKWLPKLSPPDDPQEATKAIEQWIWPPQRS